MEGREMTERLLAWIEQCWLITKSTSANGAQVPSVGMKTVANSPDKLYSPGEEFGRNWPHLSNPVTSLVAGASPAGVTCFHTHAKALGHHAFELYQEQSQARFL